jgi:predicted nucleotidyltransferase
MPPRVDDDGRYAVMSFDNQAARKPWFVGPTGIDGRMRYWNRTIGRSAMQVAGRDIDLDALAAICRRYGIAELAVFGSVARGEERPDSDLDLFYVLAPDARLGWEIADLNDELAELFGRTIDLGSRRSLHRLVRDEMLAEARVIYAEAA